MAKRKAKTNKTQAIKDYLADHPKAGPKEIAEALNKRGFAIKPKYVSTIKTNMKAKSKATKKAAPRRRAASDQVSMAALLEAKKLAAKLGGIEKAKQALGALAQLTD